MNNVYTLLLAPRPAGEARTTSIPRVVCEERERKPAGPRAAARRGAAAEARAKVQTFFIDRPLPPVIRGHRPNAILGLLSVMIIGWQVTLPNPACAEQGAAFTTASFIDKRGLMIEDLSKDEVRIFENDQPRKIEFMAEEEVPTVYGLVFDLSMLPEHLGNDYRGSTLVISSATAARSLAYHLIDKCLGRQTMWVAAYEKDFSVIRDFTTDGFSAKAAIEQMHGNVSSMEPFLYTALFSAIMKMNTRTEKRRVIILFTSGLDRETSGKLKALKNLLSASNVELFLVSFASRLGSTRGGLQAASSQAALKTLAQSTSGEAFLSADYGDHFEDIARSLYNEIRTLYTFGFESAGTPDKPSRLTIRCTRLGSRVRHHPSVAILP